MKCLYLVGSLGLLVSMLIAGAASSAEAIRVTVDNFERAESDTYFAKFVKQGGFGKFSHERELAPIDNQTVVRLNRDTLYSFAVFDLNAAPVTVTLPNSGQRFMSLQVIDEDQYTADVFYAPGSHTFTKELVGTRYVCLAVRTFVDPNDPVDVKAVHALQDAIKSVQEAAGKFEVPDWDAVSQKAVREALLNLAAANGGLDSARMFGRRGEVDPVQHLIGTAAGWGGNPPAAALYVGVVPEHNDGKTVYRLTVKDVPVDGFWSISVYNKDGYFVENPENAYTLNNITAQADGDGSYTIQFGGCDGKTPNCLPIMPGWNYTVRMYRPRKEILDGTWTFPVAKVEGSASDKGNDSASSQLEGIWLLRRIDGSPVPENVKTPSLTVAADGSVSGFSGVNRFSGKLAEQGKNLFGPLAATKMAGPPAAMALEAKFFRALAQVSVARQSNRRLELASPDDVNLLEFESQ